MKKQNETSFSSDVAVLEAPVLEAGAISVGWDDVAALTAEAEKEAVKQQALQAIADVLAAEKAPKVRAASGPSKKTRVADEAVLEKLHADILDGISKKLDMKNEMQEFKYLFRSFTIPTAKATVKRVPGIAKSSFYIDIKELEQSFLYGRGTVHAYNSTFEEVMVKIAALISAMEAL